MARRAARAGLTLCLLGSVAATGWTGIEIARNPALAPLTDRAASEIVAATDRLLAREASADRVAALITDHLAQDPRNWIALAALEDVAAERALALPPALVADIAAARATDTGTYALAADCVACAWDAAACSLSNVMLCQMPVALTPLGDVAGLSRAGIAWVAGTEIDEIDLGLSIAGLGATALVLASGGSSAMVKVGAATAKLARRMNLLSPRLTALATDAMRRGVDWAALPGARSTDDLVRAVRIDAFAPVITVAGDLGRMRDAVGTTHALHLLRHIDDATDARRMADAAQALGPRAVGRVEVLGKARVLRATQKITGAAWQTLGALCALLASGAALAGGAAQSLMLRLMRRALR